jgi:hypothetical protein
MEAIQGVIFYLGGVVTMKRLSIIIALLVIVIQNSFNISEAHSSQETTAKRFIEKVNLELNGPVKKVTVCPDDGDFTNVYYFDANGCLRQKEMQVESSTTVHKITDYYDNKERIIKESWSLQENQHFSSFSWEFNYDDSSHTYSTTSTQEGKVEFLARGILDNLGNLIEHEAKSYKTFREFNEFGQQTKVTVYRIDGSFQTRREMSYTPAGRLLMQSFYMKRPDGDLDTMNKYFYENDRLAKSVEMNLLKQITTETITYEYLTEDNFHNWTKMKKTITTGEGTRIVNITRQIEYFK